MRKKIQLQLLVRTVKSFVTEKKYLKKFVLYCVGEKKDENNYYVNCEGRKKEPSNMMSKRHIFVEILLNLTINQSEKKN